MIEDRYDVIIVGTGAGGGTLAHELAPTGKRILLLERGGYLPRERENWSSRAVFVDNRYKAQETWLDGRGGAFRPGIHYCVGGNTKFYGAVLFRMRERDFGAVTHRDGESPAWPLSYGDFAPYYLRAEALYHVHGERGSDPTEPPEDAPYPWPAISHEPRVQELADGLRRSGLKPFALPIGVQLNEAEPTASACIRCDTCDGFPCLVEAKSDAHVTCVRPALAYPNVELVTNAFVERLETSTTGREVVAVVVNDGTHTRRYRSDIVVVSCGAVNSAALLLRSGNDRHPKGLGNGSDVVGRHYMFHNNSAMLALSTKPNKTKFQKTLGLNDYYWGDEDYKFPLGHIQMLGKTDAAMFDSETHGLLPNRILEKLAGHSLDFWLTSEDLPLPQNRVTVANEGIRIAYSPTNVEAHQRLTAKLRDVLKQIDGDHRLAPRWFYFSKRLPVSATGHQNGTVRFGANPSTSALDLNCRSHEVDNLYVVDSSFFPSSSAVNPTLTIIANALRVADHLKTRMGAASPAAAGGSSRSVRNRASRN
jgi:choline dehydrogenase-like flavoprotein